MDSVSVFLYSRSAHNRQIITGFRELKKQGKISLEIIENYDSPIDHYLPSRDILEATINGTVKIAFDMTDGYFFDTQSVDKYLSSVEYYFKRSFSEIQNLEYSENNRKKIHPLSFNWDISYFFNPIEWYKSFKSFQTLVKKFVMPNSIKYYEREIKKNGPPIIFMCRLWADDGSENVTDAELVERTDINEMRINIIRRLKEEFKDDFIGGVEDNNTSRKLCPDLIMPMYYTKKMVYIKSMKKASICIASTGLHKSIGWKFGEYVAAGKAIVSEKLNYEVIGDFQEGKNYLEYSTVDECVECVKKLYNNRQLLESMELNNKEYYYKYCRPDKLIEYVLNMI
ncbi:MAG: hypothetical protein IJ731_04935 [Eubacterium sp.]|nr:hypothetical protein [Eubacterium sp.]